MKDELEKQIAAACKEVFDAETEVALTRPEEQFGDYATNVALQLSKQIGKNPREIAEALAVKLRETLTEQIDEVTIAGPGFLNFKLNSASLSETAKTGPARIFEGQQVLVEFGDPNPFKAMHLGHLYSTIVGDTISRLLETAGADVKRLSYHGDVGMHVAKAIWAVKKAVTASTASIADCFETDTTIGNYYTQGAKAYDEDSAAKESIETINQAIYAYHNGEKIDDLVTEIYEIGCRASFDYFDKVFAELGVHYAQNGRYLESKSTVFGLEFVKQNIGKVFEESEGAVIYRGEKAGLHTRVFINSRGLPTYEAKDLGLTELKHRDFPQAAKSIIITAHEQSEYFKVMLAALSEIDPALAAKTSHIAHGFLSLTTGKMSSRSGDVYAATNLMAAVHDAVKAQYPEASALTQTETYLAAIKYAFLKNRIGGDIVFDVEESVALEGNSGPYLQYAHARARSILRKAEGTKAQAGGPSDVTFEPDEKSLLRKIGGYSETVDKAIAEMMPHHVCTYLYELAQTFNRFYEHNRVIGDERQFTRLLLVGRYAQTLRDGLELLGIVAPEQM